jgi:serine/threonine protein kinase
MLQHIYLIFELEHTDMRKLFRAQTTLTEQEVKLVMFGVLQALLSMHSCNIIHRDIKLGNILYSQGKAVLCDFGSSRLIETDVVEYAHKVT